MAKHFFPEKKSCKIFQINPVRSMKKTGNIRMLPVYFQNAFVEMIEFTLASIIYGVHATCRETSSDLPYWITPGSSDLTA